MLISSRKPSREKEGLVEHLDQWEPPIAATKPEAQDHTTVGDQAPKRYYYIYY